MMFLLELLIAGAWRRVSYMDQIRMSKIMANQEQDINMKIIDSVKLAAVLLAMIFLAGEVYAEESNGKPENEHAVVKLWPGEVPGKVTENGEHAMPDRGDGVTRLTDVSCPTMTLYLLDKKSPAVLVCPGGGYSILAINKEGYEIAEWLNSVGFNAIVLKYRVPGNRAGAFQDVQRAMGLIRQNAEQWKIDAEKVGVMGFSAGGHLSARLSTNYAVRSYEPVDKADELSCRPDFTILVYPAYLSKENYGLADEIKVDDHTPPAFLIQAQNDRSYVDSSIAYYLALKEAGVHGELHLFPSGGHGFGLRGPNPTAVAWPKLCEAWLNKISEE